MYVEVSSSYVRSVIISPVQNLAISMSIFHNTHYFIIMPNYSVKRYRLLHVIIFLFHDKNLTKSQFVILIINLFEIIVNIDFITIVFFQKSKFTLFCIISILRIGVVYYY